MNTYSEAELQDILEQHKLWLEGDRKGKKANLSFDYLNEANLEYAHLRGANLGGADLTRASLKWADLRGCNLSVANLEGANFYETNLKGADLSFVSLRGANLIGANLTSIKGKLIYSFSGPKNWAYAADGYIKIGCECHPIAYWLENYKAIGERAKYTLEEIEVYGDWIKSLRGLL